MINLGSENLLKYNPVVIRNSIPEIGYISRTFTQGKEYEMVCQYIDHLKSKYAQMKNVKAFIFVEPQIESGYPDIVVVEFFSLPQKAWNAIRSNLNSTDLKILYYIQIQKKVHLDKISEILGYPLEIVKKSVNRLSECGMIRLHTKKGYAENAALSAYCKINKVIAIEAKIDKWQEAIRQANNNTWFATESYILLNKKNCATSVIDACKENGIGLITLNGKIEKVLSSNKRKFPVSYASLQFNEWVLRLLNYQ